MTTTEEESAPQMVIDKLPERTFRVPIVGTTPLLMHRFSEKAKKQMLDATQGRKTVKQPKDPQAEYEAAFYRLKGDDGFGFPVTAFKLATVGAARFYDKSVTMTALRQCMFFRGEPGNDGQSLAPIFGEPEMREDVVRVGRGGSDLRYRPQFREWSTTLEVTIVATMIDDASLLSLIDAGGLGIGVGDWRPERGGEFGMYRIDPTRDVEAVS